MSVGTARLAIIDAIVAGQRNPVELAKLRDSRIKASAETIEKSLVGTWRAEHLFTLKESRDLLSDVPANRSSSVTGKPKRS